MSLCFTRIFVDISACTCAFECVCARAGAPTCVSVCTGFLVLRLLASAYTDLYAQTNTHIYTHTNTHLYAHTNTHLYAHTNIHF